MIKKSQSDKCKMGLTKSVKQRLRHLLTPAMVPISRRCAGVDASGGSAPASADERLAYAA